MVLSEDRARDVPPAWRAQKTEVAQSLAGTLVPEALAHRPALRASSRATAEKLRRYYTANYRPDNATLVIVGNIDVDTPWSACCESGLPTGRAAVPARRPGPGPAPAAQSTRRPRWWAMALPDLLSAHLVAATGHPGRRRWTVERETGSSPNSAMGVAQRAPRGPRAQAWQPLLCRPLPCCSPGLASSMLPAMSQAAGGGAGLSNGTAATGRRARPS